MNARMDEVLLDHDLPVAIFTSYRDEARHHASWSPFCAHSPEWVALTEGRRHGRRGPLHRPAGVAPGLLRPDQPLRRRRAPAHRRHRAPVPGLRRRQRRHPVGPPLRDRPRRRPGRPPHRLLRPGAGRRRRLRRGQRPRGVHGPVGPGRGGRRRRPAGRRRDRRLPPAGAGPAVRGRRTTLRPGPRCPSSPTGSVGGSYLVPFSFRRLDAFDGYQSGMPSPHYYQRLWEAGTEAAGEDIVASVVARLRRRRQHVSTADLIAARTLALGLAALRGHPTPGPHRRARRAGQRPGHRRPRPPAAVERPRSAGGRHRSGRGRDGRRPLRRQGRPPPPRHAPPAPARTTSPPSSSAAPSRRRATSAPT